MSPLQSPFAQHHSSIKGEGGFLDSAMRKVYVSTVLRHLLRDNQTSVAGRKTVAENSDKGRPELRVTKTNAPMVVLSGLLGFALFGHEGQFEKQERRQSTANMPGHPFTCVVHGKYRENSHPEIESESVPTHAYFGDS